MCSTAESEKAGNSGAGSFLSCFYTKVLFQQQCFYVLVDLFVAGFSNAEDIFSQIYALEKTKNTLNDKCLSFLCVIFDRSV